MSEFIFPPPQPIEQVSFIHGWTLTPDRPALYRNTATFIENVFDIETSVPAMPNTDILIQRPGKRVSIKRLLIRPRLF